MKVAPTVATSRVIAIYSVDGVNYDLCKFTLNSVTGQEIISVPLKSSAGKQEINLPSGIAKGVYFCLLVCDGQVMKTEVIFIR